MPAAKPDHDHHCSCPKLPEDVWRRIQGAFAKHGEHHCREILRIVTGVRDPAALRPHPSASHRSRILAKVSIPDARGHQHWLGPWPKFGVARAMFGGTTRDIVQWLYLWDDPFNIVEWDAGEHFERTCHDPMCISPDHHRLPKQEAPPLSPNSAALEAWEAAHPKPLNPKSVKWITKQDYRGELCMAGHPLTVYTIRPRKSYCRQCAALMRTWDSERRAEIARIESRVTSLPPRVPNEPQLPPYYADVRSPEPPLADAEPELEPEDTLVGKLQRM